MKLLDHFGPVLCGVGMSEVRPNRRNAIPDFSDERISGRVPDEDVHLEAEVERRIRSGGFGSGYSRVNDRDVMHPILQWD